ncbi:TMEM165/GDT1 family protein [Nocardioides sp. PD653-B2]|nr:MULTISPECIES: TMEM165/GDT1 family protein [unclassified Nocardioides]
MRATITLATHKGWLGTWIGSTVGMDAAHALAIVVGAILARQLRERHQVRRRPTRDLEPPAHHRRCSLVVRTPQRAGAPSGPFVDRRARYTALTSAPLLASGSTAMCTHLAV